MIAPDVNLLLYAHNERAPKSAAAQIYVQKLLAGTEIVGLPVVCIHGFLRMSTNPVFGNGTMTMSQAMEIVEDWLVKPHVKILYPGPNHWQILSQLLTASKAGHKLLTDAVIAAIAVEHNAVIHSADSDFKRFPGVRWLNPLAN